MYFKAQIVPRSKHTPSQLMLCREVIAVCSEIHIKHTYTQFWERQQKL
jgi:hypothetical protein